MISIQAREAVRRRRVFRRAAVAWQAGKPHTAWEILRADGYGEDVWREFQREALRRARATYRARIARA